MKNVNYNKIVIESQDLIRNIDGITGSDAFEEIIKIIFTMNLFSTQKLDSTSLKFFYTDKVFPKYDFFIGDYIKLKDITIEQILYLFSDVDFESEDIRGRLFETYLGRVFTSGLGQFFTPREIVEFITGFLHKKNLIPKNALILDPACGSSGILLTARNSETGKIVGYDINERLVRVSKMNMVLHGIENYEINNQSFLKCPDEEIYDVCITNPPFGVEEKQKDILKEFINCEDNPVKLKEFYNSKTIEIKNRLFELNKKTSDQVTKIKLTETIGLLAELGKNDKVNNDHMVNLLQYCDLLDELKKING